MKFLRQALTVLLIVAGLLTTAIVAAAVQIFDGKGQWHTSDAETESMAKARAQQRAQLDAQKKAGLAIKTFSRSINNELTDDEVSAVTANIIELVGDVHFDKQIIPLSDSQTTILYTATLKAKIDPDGVYDFVKRDDKTTVVRQNTQLQDAVQKNDELAASLTEKYNRAASQAERDRIRKQMEQADRDFLANQKLEEGYKRYYFRNYHGAIKFYDEAIQLNPNSARAYNKRAIAYDKLKNYEQALADYNEAIKLDPNFGVAYYNRGLIYHQQKQYERAIQDFSAAIKFDPNDADYYKYRGEAYSALEQYDSALQDFDKVIALNPNDVYAYFNRGYARYNLQQYELAVKDFDKFIEFKPDDLAIQSAEMVRDLAQDALNRGNVQADSQVDSHAKEIQDLTKKIELEPNNFLNYMKRATAYLQSGDYNSALKDADKVVELKPDALSYSFRAIVYTLLKDYERAVKDYDKAIKLEPDNVDHYKSRAKCHFELKDYERTVKDYNKAIELDPKHRSEYEYRIKEANNKAAESRDKSGDYNRTIEDYTKQIEQNPNDAGLYVKRALAYAELKKYNQAIRDYNKAIELKPNSAVGYLGRGTVYDELEKFDLAFQDFDKVIQIEPTTFKALYTGRGDYYKNRKQYNKAVLYYDKAIQLNPKDAAAYASRGACYQELGDNAKAQADFDKAKALGYNG